MLIMNLLLSDIFKVLAELEKLENLGKWFKMSMILDVYKLCNLHVVLIYVNKETLYNIDICKHIEEEHLEHSLSEGKEECTKQVGVSHLKNNIVKFQNKSIYTILLSIFIP